MIDTSGIDMTGDNLMLHLQDNNNNHNSYLFLRGVRLEAGERPLLPPLTCAALAMRVALTVNNRTVFTKSPMNNDKIFSLQIARHLVYVGIVGQPHGSLEN